MFEEDIEVLDEEERKEREERERVRAEYMREQEKENKLLGGNYEQNNTSCETN